MHFRRVCKSLSTVFKYFFRISGQSEKIVEMFREAPGKLTRNFMSSSVELLPEIFEKAMAYAVSSGNKNSGKFVKTVWKISGYYQAKVIANH